MKEAFGITLVLALGALDFFFFYKFFVAWHEGYVTDMVGWLGASFLLGAVVRGIGTAISKD